MKVANKIIENQDHEGMLRRALERIIQLYTDKAHFIYELLQNAEDAGASRIKFLQFDDRLEVIHNGHPFSMANLQGIFDIGKSDKINKLNQIGEFGVGFKSVFGICERVLLYSHPTDIYMKTEYPSVAVEIENFTHPHDIDDRDIEPGYTTRFVFPYAAGLSFSGFDTIDQLKDGLADRLQNLGITTLLFMKNLEAIEYSISLPNHNTSGIYMLKKEKINDHCQLVSAIGETNNVRKKEESLSYLIFSRPVADLQIGKSIDIALSVNVGEDGKYEFKSTKNPYISVYFPTETESKLKFIVQGPYRTTPNRSSVPADDRDNIKLAKQTTQLLYDSVIELRDNGLLNLSLLNILPIDQSIFFNESLFECMYKKTISLFRKECILPGKDIDYVKSSNAVIARNSDFADLFAGDLLTELFDDGTDHYWLPTVLTETNKRYKALYEFLTSELGIKVIRPERVGEYFNKNTKFLYQQNDEWLVRFYKVYSEIGGAFSKQRGSNNMLTAKIIKTSSGEFVSSYRTNDDISNNNYYRYLYYNDVPKYVLNVFRPIENMDEIEGLNFVDREIFDKCKDFFVDTVGIQAPDAYAFFVADYEERQGVFNSDKQHIHDLKCLLKYKDDEKYKEEIDALLKKYLHIRCSVDDEYRYVNPYKDTVYVEKNKDNVCIKEYFKDIKTFAYVDEEYYRQHGINLEKILSLNVNDSIVLCSDQDVGTYYTGNPGRQPDWHTYGSFRWKLTLMNLSDVIMYISTHPKSTNSIVKSSIIFNFLVNNESKLFGDVFVGNDMYSMHDTYSDIINALKKEDNYILKYNWDGKWLFTKTGRLVSPCEISRRELSTDYYEAAKPESKLYEYLGFKRTKDDVLEETERVYDKMPDEQKSAYFEIELKRRFNITIKDLEDTFVNGQNYNNYSSNSVPENNVCFPSLRVKNWNSLRKHVTEAFCFASPVIYERKLISIRNSRKSNDGRIYLGNMYKENNLSQYVCQMCHNPMIHMEMCQIFENPKIELDQMNLCLCPNCAARYKKLRHNAKLMKDFSKHIRSLTDSDIENEDPIKVSLDKESIWFTQTHVAEIRELLVLEEDITSSREDVDSAEINPDKRKKIDEVVSMVNKDVAKGYVGKKMYHTTYEAYGTIIACDGKLISVRMETGEKAGMICKFNYEICIQNNIIRIMQ